MRTRAQRVASVLAVAAVTVGLAACGGSDNEAAGGGTNAAADFESKLSKKPVELSFIWFEWPPAQALEELGKEYSKTRPNVTVKVNTVPIANWHDAIFTQFAAQKTNFDMPILDSQYIGEAVENGNILDLTDFAKKNVDDAAYDPYFLAAYGQYPQTKTGEPSPDSKTYGLPLMGDTWTMVYRKDLIKQEPKTWDEMIAAAKQCQADNPGMSGLAFHQANATDAAAVTYNTVNGVYGGELWDPEKQQIEGVVNNAAGQKAMDVLVNQMKPLTPKGSGNWFIDEVNAAINQGKVCIGFQWIGASGGLLDPKSSKLGKTPDEILKKLAFTTLPGQDSDFVPLGGMGMHISKYAPEADQAEALNFMKWFQSPEVQKKWAELGGVPGRKDALASQEFLNAAPFNKVFTDSVSRLRDFWNLPEYTKLVNIQTQNVNAALNGTEKPKEALDKIASEQQAILDESK
jgi:multiple sugar transport system substrate-binding protein